MELQIFENKQFGQVRMVELEGQPYFVGKDVADILGYQNGSRDINRHVDEEDRQNYQNGTFGNRGVTVINESGLYSLILSSKLPQAKEFKRWVTSEVLPTIRKHGTYVTDQKAVDIATNPNALGEFLQRITDQVKSLEQKNEALVIELEETKPKAEYYDLMLANKGLIKTSEIAKNYGKSARAFNQLLHKLKVIYKQGDTWLPYAKYQTHNYVQLEPFSYTNSKGLPDVKMRTKWTMKGHVFLYELLKKNEILPLIEQ
ncbi:Phage antirepressor protein [Streptococcus oralis]|uniref:Phage antirepressor protein n=1 Tax=Streptococcus oralis TaxID=1303 RepID=A0A139RIP2_STROR|nr:phage antirepressor [Streptococcus oralis]KXU14606.1 Phage antirepressor protein [Streptococcus oralis]